MKRTLIILFALLLALPVCVQAEEEFSYHSIVPTPHVTLITPQAGQSYDAGGKLRVQASGKNVLRMKVTLTYEGQNATISMDGAELDYTLRYPAVYQRRYRHGGRLWRARRFRLSHGKPANGQYPFSAR